MYVRASRSGKHTYLRLVESFRDDAGHTQQRQIAQLGRLDQISDDQVERLVKSLLRATGVSAPTSDMQPDFQPSLEVGGPWLFTELWRELGIGAGLKKALRSSRRQFDAEALIRVMVLNRLCDPESKLGVLRWLETVIVPGLDTSTIQHQQLLRAMDCLTENADRVENAVATLLRPLIDQDLSVVFYDLTTIKIHGEAELENDLRRWGYSKDLAGTGRQWVLGLIQTAEGLPLAHEVFPGNIAEVSTLMPMLQRCLRRFPIRRAIVIADRGLLSLDNLEELEALNTSSGQRLEYVLAVPASRYKDFSTHLSTMRFDKDKASVCEGTWNERRLVVAHDPHMADIATQRRREKLDELVAFGDALANKLDAQDEGQTSRGRRATDRGAYRRFTQTIGDAEMGRFIAPDMQADRFSFAVKGDAVANAEALDGKLLLVTNVTDMERQDIVDRYKSLADIERSFRVLKSDIDIAPVYHRLSDRIRAHAAICFLALLLHRVLQQRLKSVGIQSSVRQVLHRVKSIQYHQLKLGKTALSGVTTLTPEQQDLFGHLELKKPSKRGL